MQSVRLCLKSFDVLYANIFMYTSMTTVSNHKSITVYLYNLMKLRNNGPIVTKVRTYKDNKAD